MSLRRPRRASRGVTLPALLVAAGGCHGHAPAPSGPAAHSVTRPPPGSTAPRETAADATPRPATTLVLRPHAAPFPEHPEVLLHVPAGFVRGDRVDVVVFLHGWRGCVRVVAGGENAPCRAGGPVRYAMDVVAQFDRAGINAVLLVPQLAFDADSSAPGRLGQPGGLRALLDEVLANPDAAAAIGGATSSRSLGRVALVPHSGAYLPAALALRLGGVDVTDVLLLDALYRPMPEFESWVRAHAGDFSSALPPARRLAMVYTDAEGTGPATRALLRRCLAALPVTSRDTAGLDLTGTEPPSDEAYRRSLLACRTTMRHEDVPRVFLAPLLEAWGTGHPPAGRD